MVTGAHADGAAPLPAGSDSGTCTDCAGPPSVPRSARQASTFGRRRGAPGAYANAEALGVP
eukprot:5509516-Heterocapsa_arctica.AAC.1